MVSGDSLARLPLSPLTQGPSTLPHASLCHSCFCHLSHHQSHFFFLLSSCPLCTSDSSFSSLSSKVAPAISLFHRSLFGTCSVPGLNLSLSCGNACHMERSVL